MAPIIRGNSLYRFVLPITWSDAEEKARELGGHLITIDSAEENQFAVDIADSGFYIGYNRKSGPWSWSSGSSSSYTRWRTQPEGGWAEPNNWLGIETVAMMMVGGQFSGYWNDIPDDGRSIYGPFEGKGLAEIPLTSSITFSSTPKEGAGVFTTSINLSAGTTSSGNLAEGATVYWKVTGVDSADLASGQLSGSGTITNGKLDLEHSLKSDSDTDEFFEVSVFSDAEMTQQIGSTRTASVEEANSIDTLPPILEELWFTHRTDENGNLLYTAHARVKDDQSGVKTGWNTSHIRVSSPSGIHQLYVTLDRFESGDNLNGVLAGDFTINKYQESGQWTVLSSRFQDSPKITDNAGNENKYSADKLAAQGISSNFFVNTPNPDITPPTLEDLWFTKTTDKEGNFHFTAHAKVKDDISGVTRTWAMTHLRLSSPTGKDKIYVVLDQLESGTPQDGIVSGTFTISKSQELGNWSVDSPEFNDSPRISDIAGNSTDYNAAKLLALGISPTFFVGYEDSSTPVPPTLQSTTAATRNQLILTFSEDLQVAGGGALDTSLLTITVDGKNRRIRRAQINPRNASEVLVTVSGRSLIYASSLDISYNTSTAPESKGALVNANGIAVDAIASTAVDTYTTTSNINARGISNIYKNLILAGSAPRGYGNSKDNILTGNKVNNTLDGLGGADTMLGGTGDDTYVVDNVADAVTELANEGTDTVQTSISYTLGENLENLVLIGRGNIDGTGNSSNNRIQGNHGANILNGNSGADTLIGGIGNDTYIVNSVDDTIIEYGSRDIDNVVASIDWKLSWRLENLTLTGSDAISGTGNNKDNTISGNDAANVLDGGNGGKDILTGAGGGDTFSFSSRPRGFRNNQADHITDFSSAEGDKIQITKRALGILASEFSLAIVNGTAEVNRALSTFSLFVYDTSGGELHFNQNGTRRGHGIGGVLAVLDNQANLSPGDFTLI